MAKKFAFYTLAILHTDTVSMVTDSRLFETLEDAANAAKNVHKVLSERKFAPFIESKNGGRWYAFMDEDAMKYVITLAYVPNP